MADQLTLDIKQFQEFQLLIRGLKNDALSGKITWNQYGAEIKTLDNIVRSYNLNLKQTVAYERDMISATKLLQMNMSNLGDNVRARTAPAMISVAQIIQDMPYGIRGIGNNIEFLAQQMTVLAGSGMKTGQIIKGMFANLLSPTTGVFIGISALTALSTIFADDLFPSVKKVNDELEKTREKIDELSGGILGGGYKTGAISASQYRGFLGQQVTTSKQALLNMLGAPESMFTEEMLFTPQSTLTTTGMFGGVKVNEENRIAVLEAQMKYVNARIKLAQFEEDLAKQRQKTNTEKKKAKDVGGAWIGKFDRGMPSFDELDLGIDQRINMANIRAGQAFDKATSRGDVADMRDELRERAENFRHIFVQPIIQGMREISNQIRTELFGTLDELQKKFGSIGGLMMNIFLSLGFDVATAFATEGVSTWAKAIFSGGKGGKSVGVRGYPSIPSMPTRPVVVQVVGEISGRNIYLANKRQGAYEATRVNG